MIMEKKTLYLQCPAGLSGDMTVAALLDLGADRKVLERALDSIKAEGFETKISRVSKAGLDCCDFAVVLDHEHENHDHDMEYLYGSGRHDHGAEHHHHDHEHGHHHEHRNFADVKNIIDAVDMTDDARDLALRIFKILAEAESKAHGIPEDQVHFHEVGAVDSIVDITAAAVCFDNLGITDVIIPELGEGTGTVRCMHGILPVPVPATADIVSAYGLRLARIDERGEFLTPTGAAIAAAVRTSDTLPEHYRIIGTGIGAGKRTYEHANIVRAVLIEPDEEKSADDDNGNDTIWKLESNIDDSSGEQLGFVMDELIRAGARDVHYIPAFMKKNRPAYILNVICQKADIPKMEEIIFLHTTTIGIRRVEMERSVLERREITVSNGEWNADVKVCNLNGEERFYPEYESVALICRKSGRAFSDVYEEIEAFCREESRENDGDI